MEELIAILTAMASKKGEIDNPLELFLDMADRIVKSVSMEFGLKTDEVAILLLTSDQKHLRFAAPRKFADLGTIPISKRDSIAVNVLARKAGEAMNNVPMVRHVSFFESVKIKDRPAAPIQKMITVPILLRGEVVGVAQVSRKGDSAAEAGPDFTQTDVAKAQDLFATISPFLVEARPERF
jgi:hypothetical protein